MTAIWIIAIALLALSVYFHFFPPVSSVSNVRANWITLTEDWDDIRRIERAKPSLELEKGGPEEPQLSEEDVIYLRTWIQEQKEKEAKRKARKSRKETETTEITREETNGESGSVN